MIKIKKCRKENCSEIRIHNKNSQLVNEYNEKLKNIPKIHQTKIKKIETEIDKKNLIYKKSIQRVQIRHFNEKLTNKQLSKIQDLIFKQHKLNKLKKSSYFDIIKKVKSDITLSSTVFQL